MPEPTCQKRPFLAQACPAPKPLNNLVTQTLGKISFDFVTFLAVAIEADIGKTRSILLFGL